MQALLKPQKLAPGDTVATVSLSWGGAGEPDLLWRYQLGKQRLRDVFGLNVIEAPHTLKGARFVYEHPELRAADLMQAFADPDVKGIFSCIGGDESVRMLPYIDFDLMRANPKVFMGYSDTTITHLMCLKAGVSSFYGPSVLAEFAENVKIFDYTVEQTRRTLFQSEVVGEVAAPAEWTGEHLWWTEANRDVQKRMTSNRGYEILQGGGRVTGRLIGGCLDVLEMAKGTELWPEREQFEGALLFLETSEDTPAPAQVEYWLRNYGSQGILQRVNGILFGKPYQEKYYEEYQLGIRKVLKELSLTDLPVAYNLSFGHTEPMCVLPYGALAELDCDARKFTILESGVVA